MDFDWIHYFEKARRLTGHESLGEPEPTPGAVLEVVDKGSEIDWASEDGTERWLRWIEHTREVGRTFSTNFREIRLRESVN
jgi:hypothetical protein